MRYIWFSFSFLAFILLCVLGMNIFWPEGMSFSLISKGQSSSGPLEKREPLPTWSIEEKFIAETFDSSYSGFSVNPPERMYSRFDGEEIAGTDAESEFLMGVMIDNSNPARKMQISLNEAHLVVEALAEGGVTRFLAFFSSRQNFDKIGPIRSARPYFFDFARPLHSLYIHAGGSDVVMVELKNQEDILDVDHHWIGNSGELFWRDDSYYAPHNLFTSTKGLKAHLEATEDKNGFAPLSDEIFDFSDIPIKGEPMTSIDTTFSTSSYDASWEWDAERKEFVRSQYGLKLDIGVENLVIMEAEMWRIANDPKGRMGMKNVGSGDIIFFQNGEYTHGTWTKDSREGRTVFFDENGVELTFLRGKTWIAILDDLQKLTIK